METTKKSQIVGIKNAGIVIICCFIIAVCIYHFLLGNPSNFMNNDPNNHPLPGNFLGTIYKGGIIVPVIQTLLLTVLALSIERYFALRSAFGKGSLAKFVANIKAALAAGDIKKAQEICDKQRGSVANVVTSTLRKYEEMEKNTSLPKEQAVGYSKRTGRSYRAGNADDATESSDYCYYHYFGNIDGIAWYCNRYDPFICRIVCRWWCRLYGFVTRYFRSFD